MRAQDVLNLITSLGKITTKANCDIESNTFLNDKFKSLDPQIILQQEHINTLVSCVHNRWDWMFSNDVNHKFDLSESNQLWMQFTKDLATAADKTCVDLLKVKSIRNTQNDKASIPIGFINKLYILLKHYKQLQQAKGDFSSFKQASMEFLHYLSSIKTETMICTFRSQVSSNNSSAFVLYYLLDIENANSFTIDKEITELSNWVEQYIHCFRFITSSLTTKFEIPFYDTGYVYVWDQCNNVTTEQNKLISQIYPAIKANNLSQLQQAYKKLLASIVVYDASRYASFFSFVWRSQSINTWMSHVKNQTLSSTGINYFPPEVYLKVLGNFKHEPIPVNKFLDSFMRTYAIREDDLIKFLRVHSLFHTLLEELSADTRKQLLIELNQVGFYQAQLEFKNNWEKLVDKRVLEIAGVNSLTEDQKATIINNSNYKIIYAQGKIPKHSYLSNNIQGDPDDMVVKIVKAYLFQQNYSILREEVVIAINKDVNASSGHGSYDVDYD